MSKIILITGTSSGFGKQMSIKLSNEGHNVIAAMRNITGKNKAVADELNAYANITVVEMDVTSGSSVQAAFENALGKFGRIDVLINNAGVTGFGFLEATSVEQMKKIFEVNVWGAIRCIQEVLPLMRENKNGLIINISSLSGILSLPYVSPYTGSKYALEGFTESLAYEVKLFGIEAVSMLPGPFPTDLGSKDSYGSDLPEVAAAYGEEELKRFSDFGKIYGERLEENQSDIREVTDAVSRLIRMEKGTRPAQTVINRMAGGIEQEYADVKISVKSAWMDRMGYRSYR